MTTSIGNRLRERRESEQLSQSSVARRVGVTPQSVQQWESNKTTPRGKRLDALAHALGCSREWLLFGSGETAKDRDERRIQIDITDALAPSSLCSTLPQQAQEARLPVSLDWIFEQQHQTSDLIAVNVYGDGMAPRIRHGDLLLANTRQTELVSGKVYVIKSASEIRISRLIRQLNGDWLLSADNSDDPVCRNERLSPEQLAQLEVVGQVIKLISGDI